MKRKIPFYLLPLLGLTLSGCDLFDNLLTNPDGTTSDEFKYTGTFTYPRLIED